MPQAMLRGGTTEYLPIDWLVAGLLVALRALGGGYGVPFGWL